MFKKIVVSALVTLALATTACAVDPSGDEAASDTAAMESGGGGELPKGCQQGAPGPWTYCQCTGAEDCDVLETVCGMGSTFYCTQRDAAGSCVSGGCTMKVTAPPPPVRKLPQGATSTGLLLH